MTERTPKSECTRKIEQDKSLKHFDIWSTFAQKLTFWKLDVCTISELRMKKRVPKSECTRKIEWGQVRFENFDFLVNICTKVNFLEIGRLHNF